MATTTPAPTDRCTLSWSDAWAIDASADTTLVLAAGSDRRIAVDGLSTDGLAAARRWHECAAVVPVTDEQHQLVDHLVELGVVQPTLAELAPVTLVGDASATAALLDHLAEHAIDARSADPGGTDLAVVIRTASDWPAPTPTQPHIGLDLTLHHTVLIGPYVVPGVTACIGCATLRSTRRWTTPPVARLPEITRHPAVVASLLAVQIRLVRAGTSPLVNATIAWDLESGTTDRESLYKMVGCATCDRAPTAGAVALPWAEREAPC